MLLAMFNGIELRPHEDPALWVDLQVGVLSLEQATTLFGRNAVRREVAARRWARPHPRVVVMHNGPRTPEQRRWVALLAAAPGSALCSWTALELGGVMAPYRPDEIFVAQPVGSRRLHLDGVRSSWSRHLGDADLEPWRYPRRTTLSRGVLDAAAWCRSDRHARAVVLSSVQQGRVPPADLRRDLVGRARCRHHAVIHESIADAQGGIDSVPEHDFSALVRTARLPDPTRQSVRRRPRGGRYFLDVEWEDYCVGCEVEGVHHFEAARREDDLDRHNEIVIGGMRLLLFTSFAVRRRGRHVQEVLARGLRQAGWRG